MTDDVQPHLIEGAACCHLKVKMKRSCGECTACNSGECEWLKGKFEEEDRPDKLGVIFTLDRPNCLSQKMLIVHEAFQGGFNNAKEKISKVAESELVLIVSESRLRVRGPRQEVEDVTRKLQRTRHQ